MIVFALFGPPVITGVRLAVNPSVEYWTGVQAWAILAVPVLLLVCHVIHYRWGRPNFYAFVGSSLLPSVIVIIVASKHFAPTKAVSHRLESSDCTTYEDKLQLQQAYDAAKTIYDVCMSRAASAAHMTLPDVQKLIDITDCPEYHADSANEYKRDWDYLNNLENQEFCSGWCHPEEIALWNRRTKPLDTCSSAASHALQGVVKSNARRMLVIGYVYTVMSIIGVFVLDETLNKMNIPWRR